MSEIVPYRFPLTGQAVRSVGAGGEVRLVLADICAVVEIANPRNVAARLPEARKGVHPVDTPGGVQNLTVVDEAGAYMVIMRSNKPQAIAFQEWLAEVATTIRKTGRYEVTAIVDPLDEIELANDRVARAVALARQERAAKERALAQVAQLEPDAARARQTMDTDGLSLVRTVAKRFGIKEKALREFLYAEKLLIRNGTSRNEPYASHVQAGHFEVKVSLVEKDPDRAPVSCSTTYVTPRGEALIWKRLHEAGYVTSRTMPPAVSEQLALVAA